MNGRNWYETIRSKEQLEEVRRVRGWKQYLASNGLPADRRPQNDYVEKHHDHHRAIMEKWAEVHALREKEAKARRKHA